MIMSPPLCIPYKFIASVFDMTNLNAMSAFVVGFANTISSLLMAELCSSYWFRSMVIEASECLSMVIEASECPSSSFIIVRRTDS